MLVVVAQPGKLVRMRNEGGIPSTFIWTYEGLDGAGTKLSLDLQYTIPAPVIGKIAEALVAKINERDADAAPRPDLTEFPKRVGGESAQRAGRLFSVRNAVRRVWRPVAPRGCCGPPLACPAFRAPTVRLAARCAGLSVADRIAGWR